MRGADVGVHHGGARALELLDLRQHLVRKGEVRARQPGPQRLAHRALVGRVPIRVEETHRDGLDSFLRRDPIDDRRDVPVVERGQHHPVPVDPLPDLEAQVTLHQRRGLLPAEVVGERDADAAKLQHVAEPVRGDERGARAPPFQNRVRGDGGGVHDLAHPARRRSLGTWPDSAGEIRGDSPGNGPRVVVRGGRHLQPVEAPVFAREDEVRERPPDVDPDPHHALHSPPPPSQCPVPGPATRRSDCPDQSTVSAAPPLRPRSWRSRAVAASSIRHGGPSTRTPYAFSAASGVTLPFRTSASTSPGSRANGSPYPPAPAVTCRTAWPPRKGRTNLVGSSTASLPSKSRFVDGAPAPPPRIPNGR